MAVSGGSPSFTNLAYTGTLTGNGGIVNLGSGQFYKDASGNVGIGTSSPGTFSAKLAVVSTAADTRISVIDDVASGRGGYLRSNFSNAVILGTTSAVRDLVFAPDNIDRGRFTVSGNFLVGETFVDDSGGLAVIPGYATGAPAILAFNKSNSAGETCLRFKYQGSQVGAISYGSSSTTYATSSDYRLKNTIAPMTGALAKVALLKPVTYKWNVDGSDGQGFIAHELQEVVEGCVTGEKDAVETYTDEDGNEATRPVYQGIDTSFLVATLTAAIQEQQAIITALTTRITALESK
jgi:hypothetical protein